MVVSEMRRAEDDIAHMKGAVTGSVAAAVTPTAALSILPKAFSAFQRRYPHARVSSTEGFPGVALPRLRDGSLDFVVAVVQPEHLGPALDYIELYKISSVVVARQDHPLAHCTSLAELVDAEWLLNPSPKAGTRTARFLRRGRFAGAAENYRVPELRHCARIAPRLGYSRDVARALAGSTMGARGYRPCCLSANLPPPIAIGVVTRRDSPLTPAAALLLDCLQDAVTSLRLNVPAPVHSRGGKRRSTGVDLMIAVLVSARSATFKESRPLLDCLEKEPWYI